MGLQKQSESEAAMAGGVSDDVRRRGLRAAGYVVDRLVAAVDGSGDVAGPDNVGEPAGNGAGSAGFTGRGTGDASAGALGRADLDGLVDLWGELAKQLLHTMIGLAGSDDPPGSRVLIAERDTGTPVGLAVEGDGSDVTVGDDVERVLREAGRGVRRAMLDAIPDGEPHEWLYRLVRSYPSRAGKALRPALCLATCRAFGGRDGDAVPVAVSIEMLHNAFLIHDDIADGSSQRRGRPTLAAEYGSPLALNAGDALAVLANQLLRRHLRTMPDELADRVLTEFETMALRTLEGQATELGWRRDHVTGLRPEDYLGLIMHKTCWYTTIHPLRVGALIGSRGQADLRPLVRFGFHLGAAFQIRDDLLNLVGDESIYGKEINGDLYEGKRTLMLIHLADRAQGRDRTTVDTFLRMGRAERTEQVVAEIRRLMDVYGSLDFATQYAEGISGAALEAFDVAFAQAQQGPDTDFVRALVPYMVGRRV
jgi:geranylgeranyl diphosphate synthase type II